jgi:hypothetical protein
MKDVTEVEKDFYYAMTQDNADWFTARLYFLILKADLRNQIRLSMGFDQEVTVVRRYQTEEGYWEDLCDRMGRLT